MANITTPFGLKPVRHLTGAPYNGQIIECYCAAGYATALYVGDPVLFSPTLTEKDATAKRPTINLSAGTTGVLIRGVIVGFAPDPDDLTKTYRPASTERIAYVVPALDDLVFHVRDDGSGTPAAVFPGQNAELANAGGNTATGLSGFALDASTPTTTQAHNVHILGLADIENNELGDYAIWEVLINTNNNTTGRFLGITAS